ncbi:MAG: hypothetical protein IH845_03155 [Nanoarchaeota archaeon]|nr:hypothetical protein [Nanoarchaeota archaeon]
MERDEKAKVGLYMIFASIPFLAIGYYMQTNLDNFYYFIPYGIFALLLAEGANRFIKNKWGDSNKNIQVEEVPKSTVKEKAIPAKEKTIEIQA